MEYIIHKVSQSRRAYEQRRNTLAFAVVLALTITIALVVFIVG